MSWNDLLAVIADAALRRLPGWLAKRIYRKDQLERDLELDIVSTHGLSFSLGYSPNVWCWLRFTNRSPLAVEVLSAEVEVWDQQPLCTPQRQVHLPVLGRTTTKIHCSGFLNEWQEQRAHQVREGGGTFAISATVVVATPHGNLKAQIHHKDSIHGDVSGSPIKTHMVAS